MKRLNYSVNSWHWKLARLVRYDPYYDSTDICTYSKYVLSGAVFALICIAMSVTVAYMLLSFILGIIFSLMAGAWVMSEAGMVTLLILALCIPGVIIGVFLGRYTEYAENKRQAARHSPKKDGFVKTAYKSWKEKFCVEIDFNGWNK